MFLALFKPHDIFISYVVEDREIVEDLISKLETRGLTIWYAKEEFFPGSDIRSVIRSGIESSRYGIALISSSYRSYWAYGELFNLMNRGNRFIPILHCLTMDEISNDPPIIEWYALSTKDGLEDVAAQIHKKVKRKSNLYYLLATCALYLKQKRRMILVSLLLIPVILLANLYLQHYLQSRPGSTVIREIIRSRIQHMEEVSLEEFQQKLADKGTEQYDIKEIKSAIAEKNVYWKAAYERNRFYFYNGVEEMKSLAAIKNSGIISSIYQDELEFGMEESRAFLTGDGQSAIITPLKYGFMNKLPVSYHILTERNAKAGLYEVEVKYTNPLRYTTTTMYMDTLTQTRYKNVTLLGLKPLETLVFENKGGRWELAAVR